MGEIMNKTQFKLLVKYDERIMNFIDNVSKMDSGERTGVIVALNFINKAIDITEDEKHAIQHIIDYTLTCKPMK